MALISQTFRGSAELQQEGYVLLQKWYRLTNAKKHQIIKEVLADGLNDPHLAGPSIKDNLKKAIDDAVPGADIAKLNY
jgi:hypothetical protein